MAIRHSQLKYDWPGGARIAVALQIPFEWWEGPHTLSIVPTIPISENMLETADELNASAISYGGQVGLWRLGTLLDEYEATATAVVSGHMAEEYPEALHEFVAGKVLREACAHSWGQHVLSYTLPREEFRKNVQRCVSALEGATGIRPVGWVSPSGQFVQSNVEVLAEEGFVYHGDYADTDSARIVEVLGKRMVCQTVPWEVNDAGQYARQRNAPSAYVELFKRAFDVLYKEGVQVVGAVAHTSIFGRPWGVSAYEEVIQYARKFPRVWFATRAEIAEAVLAQP